MTATERQTVRQARDQDARARLSTSREMVKCGICSGCGGEYENCTVGCSRCTDRKRRRDKRRNGPRLLARHSDWFVGESAGACAWCCAAAGQGRRLMTPEITELQWEVLDALKRRAGAGTVHSLIVEGFLTSNRSPIAYGVALSWLERKGLVESYYPSVESAGVPKVWRIPEARA